MSSSEVRLSKDESYEGFVPISGSPTFESAIRIITLSPCLHKVDTSTFMQIFSSAHEQYAPPTCPNCHHMVTGFSSSHTRDRQQTPRSSISPSSEADSFDEVDQPSPEIAAPSLNRKTQQPIKLEHRKIKEIVCRNNVDLYKVRARKVNTVGRATISYSTIRHDVFAGEGVFLNHTFVGGDVTTTTANAAIQSSKIRGKLTCYSSNLVIENSKIGTIILHPVATPSTSDKIVDWLKGFVFTSSEIIELPSPTTPRTDQVVELYDSHVDQILFKGCMGQVKYHGHSSCDKVQQGPAFSL
jgi:hypothetical protein